MPRVRTERDREYSRATNARRKRDGKRLALAARERPCEDCGVDHLPAAVMHLHHRDPAEKLFQIGGGRSWHRPLSQIRAEIAKCAVLCPNCHALRHYFEAAKAGILVTLP